MTHLFDSTPREDGFRMPAEFSLHAETWMAWPERTDNWRLGAKPAQHAFAMVAEAIVASEPVTMAVSPDQWQHARDVLAEEIRVVEMTANDSWMRDMGPTIVVNDEGRRRGVDWIFNAWGGLEGGLYFPWDQDELVARKLLDDEQFDRYRAPIVLEGGSIHVDGEGTLLTTEQCLLNRNRNPGMTRGEIEEHLRDYTGAETIVWLGEGVYNDETSGHVDNLACFAAPGRVLLTWTEDTRDPQYEISLDARRRLEAAKDARGRSFEVILVPSPGPLLITEEEAGGVDPADGTLPRNAGDRLAASYVNFYIANSRIIAPLLDRSVDDEALAVLADAFPGRRVVGIDAREILLGGGDIHCITQQIPAATSMTASAR